MQDGVPRREIAKDLDVSIPTLYPLGASNSTVGINNLLELAETSEGDKQCHYWNQQLQGLL